MTVCFGSPNRSRSHRTPSREARPATAAGRCSLFRTACSHRAWSSYSIFKSGDGTDGPEEHDAATRSSNPLRRLVHIRLPGFGDVAGRGRVTPRSCLVRRGNQHSMNRWGQINMRWVSILRFISRAHAVVRARAVVIGRLHPASVISLRDKLRNVQRPEAPW